MSRGATEHTRGIVLYDALFVPGGAEHVTLGLARALQATLCIGYRDAQNFPLASIDDLNLIDLARWSRIVPLRYVKLDRAFARRRREVATYDWRVFSGASALQAAPPRGAGHNLYYCHAVPSFAYDLEAEYLARTPRALRPALRRFNAWFRPRYAAALRRMDRVVANSRWTRDLIRERFGIDAVVLHPPVDVDRFRWRPAEGYYLSTARLEPHKNVACILDAFRELPDQRLVVAGWGSEGAALRRRAAGMPNVEFTGWVDQARMAELVGGCIATLYIASHEPFGMSPVESLAAGKPVIAVDEGGLRDTVDTRCGILLAPTDRTPARLAAAVRSLTPAAAADLRAACEAAVDRGAAQPNSHRQFAASIRQIVGC